MKEQSEHNPALEDLDFFAGEWEMELSHPSFPPRRDETAHGHLTCEWIEDGALFVMRQAQSSEGPSLARWIVGRDESGADYAVLYSDNRGVSRVYEMSLTEGLWQLWRTAPGFSQRFEGRISPDRKTILARWEKSFDGATWEHDFDIAYLRL